MIAIVKRLIKIFLFKGPYKFVTLNSLEKRRYRKGIHEPEGQIQRIKKENGAAFFYEPYYFLDHDKLVPPITCGRFRYLEYGLFKEPPRMLYSIHYAGSIGNSGLVYLPASREIIAETAVSYRASIWNHPVMNAVRTSPPVFINGLSLFIGKLDAEGFYHFFFESLPKLFFCNELLSKIDHIVISGELDQVKKNWLELAGVKIEKVLCTSGITNYHYEQLLFCSDLSIDMQPNPWNITILQRCFPKKESPRAFRWIWASRSDATTRKMETEEEILSTFPQFEKVNFSVLNPSAVIELMSECLVFCGPHGAAFSNLIFANKACAVIEIYFEDEHFFRPLYNRLSQICGLRHLYIKNGASSTDNLASKIKKSLDLLNIHA